MACCGLCRRRTFLVPTLWGWLLLFIGLVSLGVGGVLGVFPFLAECHPCDTGPVVVEGWSDTFTLRTAMDEFHRHHTPVLYVTGGALDDDLVSITHMHSHAELGAMRLEALGLLNEQVQPVGSPDVLKDRTFTEGVTLKQWFTEHGGLPSKLTVVTEGPHARRSRMLYQKAFGDATQIGVLASISELERTRRWWTYSWGFRTVTDETIAYLYARLLFRN